MLVVWNQDIRDFQGLNANLRSALAALCYSRLRGSPIFILTLALAVSAEGRGLALTLGQILHPSQTSAVRYACLDARFGPKSPTFPFRTVGNLKR